MGLDWLIEKFQLRGEVAGGAELPKGDGPEPTMDEIMAKVLKHKHGPALINGRWKDVRWKDPSKATASDGFYVLECLVLEAARFHGPEVVEFLLNHTAFGRGEIDDSRDPSKYARRGWVEKDVARIAGKLRGAQEKIMNEFKVESDGKVGMKGDAAGTPPTPPTPPTPTPPTPPTPTPTPPSSASAVVDFAARFAELQALKDDGVLVQGLLGRRRITNIAAGPKTGKSTWLLAALAGFAAAEPRELPGFGKPAKQLSVLYLSENHPDDDAVTLAAFGGMASALHGVDRRKIPQEVMATWSDFLVWVAQVVLMGAYDVVVLDSFEAWVPDLEDGNSGAQIAQRYGELSRRVAQACNVAVGCVLHTKKDAGSTLNFDDMLGSTKFRASSDYNIMLARVAPDDLNDTRIVLRREGRDPWGLIRRLCGRLPDWVPAAIRDRDHTGPARLCYTIVGKIEHDEKGRERASMRYELVPVPDGWTGQGATGGRKLTAQQVQQLDDQVLEQACRLHAAEVGPKPVGVRKLVKDGFCRRAAVQLGLPASYMPPGDSKVQTVEERLIKAGRLIAHGERGGPGSGVTLAPLVFSPVGQGVQ